MLVSTRGRYALRMMVELATKAEGEYTSLKDISHRQDISIKYLEQISSLLSKSGLLKSARGANGGYRLVKRPDQYTVREILLVTEGSLAPVACLGDECANCEHGKGDRRLSFRCNTGRSAAALLRKGQQRLCDLV